MRQSISADDKLRFLVSVIKTGKVSIPFLLKTLLSTLLTLNQLGAVDWGVVVEANGINKSAAYMRYARIVKALGDETTPNSSPNSAPSSAPTSKLKKVVKHEDDEEYDYSP